MRTPVLAALLALSCASSAPPPACPDCYRIDEVAPYEPPQRMIILCADPPPDAGVLVDDGGEFTGPIQF